MEYSSTRELKLKIKLHMKVCKNPPEEAEVGKPKVFTLEVNKVALNKNDDKRIAKEDGISTLARGKKDLSWSPTLGELFLIEKC